MLLISALTIQIAYHFFAWHYGLYRKAWSYASIGELKSIFKAVTLTIAVVMADLMKLCIETGVRTQTIPRIEDLMTGKVSVTDMQDVNIEDLLGRDEIELDLKAIANKVTNKTILVAGVLADPSVPKYAGK